MKKRDGIFSALSIVLVLALLVGLNSSLLGAGRSEPENPIDSPPEHLYAESLQGSGSLYGDASEN